MSVRWVELEQLLDLADHLRNSASLSDSNHQRELPVFIHHVEELDSPPVYGLVDWK